MAEVESKAEGVKSNVQVISNAEERKPVEKKEAVSAPDAAEDENTEMGEEKMQRACRQIEFYFADSNLPYDRFMWGLHTANKDHWVPIKTVASFKRMREFSPLGDEWLLNALKTSKELEVDESGTKIRRIHEVQEPNGQFERSIYAKGFGMEVPDLQQKLERYFNNFGRVNAVRMRRNNDTKEFKGSVFVEFSDKSTVDRFLNAEPKPSWNGEELLIMTKDAYCEMKIKEKGLTGKAAVNRRERESGPGLRKGFNAFREVSKKSKKEKKEEKEASKPKADVFLDFMGTRLRVIEEDRGRVEESEVPYVKSSSLKVSGFEGELVFKDIKEPLKEHFEFTFVKYDKGKDWALVGFDRALTEEDIDFVKNTIREINSKPVSWSSAEEGEERAFLVERAQSAARRAVTAISRGRGGARGGKGRGGGRVGPRRQATKEKAKSTASAEKGGESSEEMAGEKRKRAVEPDGGPDVGVRGVAAPPIVQSSSKRHKLDEDVSSTPVAASS